MAQCKWCGQKGWLLGVGKYGLCGKCGIVIGSEIDQAIKHITESIAIVQKSKNLDTILSRIDFMANRGQQILKYEEKGLLEGALGQDILPSNLLKTLEKVRNGTIEGFMVAEHQKAAQKAGIAQTPRAKTGTLLKVLQQIREYKNKATERTKLEELEKQITREINQIQLDSNIEEAKKAEFKGQKKKALDRYYEALYLLRNPQYVTQEKQQQAQLIESKIKELGGDIHEIPKDAIIAVTSSIERKQQPTKKQGEGVVGYMRSCVLDDEICPLCKWYDGMIIPVDHPDVNEFTKEQHPDDRCMVYEVLSSMRPEFREPNYKPPPPEVLEENEKWWMEKRIKEGWLKPEVAKDNGND